MSRLYYLPVLLSLALSAFGCTRKQEQVTPPEVPQKTNPTDDSSGVPAIGQPGVVQPGSPSSGNTSVGAPGAGNQQTPGTSNGSTPGTNNNGGNITIGIGPGETTASIPVVLQEAELKSKYNLDTSNLNYKFSYLAKQFDGAVSFVDGKATLTFKDLEADKSGKLTLDLYEGSTHKLHGEIAELKLTRGTNNRSITLKAVDAPDTADVTVTISLPDDLTGGNNGGGNNGGGNNGGGNNGGGNNGGGNNGGGNNGGGNNGGGNNGGGNNGGGNNGNTISFDGIKPILNQHCGECHHSNGHRPNLTDLSNSSVNLIDAAIDVIESGTMPPEPRDKVDNASLQKLKDWRAQNN